MTATSNSGGGGGGGGATNNNNKRHRSGSLKQTNKKNKRTIASKRSIHKKQGGRIQSKKVTTSTSTDTTTTTTIISSNNNSNNNNKSHNKFNRKNLLKQLRDQKNAAIKKVRQQHQGITATDSIATTTATATATATATTTPIAVLPTEKPPRIVGIVSLTATTSQIAKDIEDHVQFTLSNVATQTLNNSANNNDSKSNCYYAQHKKDGYITYVTPSLFVMKSMMNSNSNNNSNPPMIHMMENMDSDNNNNNDIDDDTMLLATLDMARICDCILFVIDNTTYTCHPNSNNGTIVNIDHSNSCDNISTAAYTNHTSATNSNKYDTLISYRGDRLLSAMKGQGLSTPITVFATTTSTTTTTTTNTSTAVATTTTTRNVHDDNDDDLDMDHNNDDIEYDMDMSSEIQSSTLLFNSCSKSITTTTTTTTKSTTTRITKMKQQLQEMKKYISRFATTEFGTVHNKVVEIQLLSTKHIEQQQQQQQQSSSTSEGQNDRDSTVSALALVRILCTIACHPPLWVSNSESSRPYIINEMDTSYTYNSIEQTLSISGYIRSGNTNSIPLDIHSTFHIPNVGTFHCQTIKKITSPWQQMKLRDRRRTTTTTTKNLDTIVVDDSNDDDYTNNMIVYANPGKRYDSLNMFATPDALNGEQNLIGFDDDDDNNNNEDDDHFDDNDKNATKETGIARPSGWSDYQSAWIDSVNDNDDEDAYTTTTNNTGIKDDIDHGELADELNRKKRLPISSNDTIGTNGMDLDHDDDDDEYNNNVSQEEKEILIEQRKKQYQDEADFPDEVQVPDDGRMARDRFARYRSVKNFRKSVWDAKENLPDSYATIYHIHNFKQTQRTVLNDIKYISREADAIQNQFFGTSKLTSTINSNDDAVMNDNEEQDDEEDDDVLDGCVPGGTYVRITLENVSQDIYEQRIHASDGKALLTVVALLPHENKVSVLHMNLCQSIGCTMNEEYPIKSKDILTFRCGWRTWQARPVFSQNNLNCDKHKYERFLPTGGTYFAASIFGPVTYTPCPILVFRERSQQQQQGQPSYIQQRELVAIGSMIGADVDRIVVKRIVLTGYPVRVHKRHATVKYMFHDPDDIKWFQPAGLYTKHGLQGNIIQSVGEHGTMKCLFNAPIKQHDTVCLPLYKRIYPKYVMPNGGNTKKNNNMNHDDKSRSGITTYRVNKPKLLIL